MQLIEGIDYDDVDPYRTRSPEALKTLQAADRKVRKAQEKAAWTSWIGQSIPDHDPQERAFTAQEKTDLLDFCYGNQRQFLIECRSLAVESSLTKVRTRDPKRNPTESDGPDLQHAAIALPYCDAFFTRDGYQASCAEFARSDLPGLSLACVCTTPAMMAGV